MTVTILVIDDSEDDQRLYQRALRDVDCRLVMASSAKDGLICLADLKPNVILLDYNLPDLDGLELIKVLTGCSGMPPPIIMLTGEGSEQVAVEVMRNGANDYLVKDTAGQYLRLLPGVITRAVASHAQREQNQQLQEETARLLRRNQLLMQKSVDGIHIMDIQGNLVEANDAFCRMLGYTQEEMVGLNVADWDAQWSAEELRVQFRNSIGKSALFETVHRRKDGTLLNVEISTSHVEMEGQHLFFALSRDITERKRAEGVLRLNKTIIETAYDGFWLFNTDGYLLEVNQAYADMVGYTREELVGKHISEISVLSNTPERVRARIEKTIAQGLGHFETQHRHKDGHVVDFEASIAFIPEASCLFSFIRDITERKHAEAVLMQHKLVLDTSIDGFWMTDAEGNLLEANEAYAKMSGYTIEELVGMHISQLEAIELTPREVQAHIEKVIAQGGHDRFETRHRHKDGHEIDIEVSVTYMAEPRQLFVFCRDITERKKVQQALVASSEQAVTEKLRLEAVMQSLPVGVAILDAQGRLLLTNAAYEQVWGDPRPATASVGDYAAYKAWWADTGEPVQPEEWASARAVLQGATVSGQMLQIRRFDGTRAFVMNSAAPIRDVDGHVTGCAVAIQDITTLKSTEEQLRKADQRKDAFLAMLAHELRNPLAPIRNAAHVLGRLDLAEPRVRWAQKIIEEQTNHLVRMVDDLLDVSRIARNKITLKKESIVLAALAERVIESARPLAERKGHRLTLRLPEQTVQLEGDPVRLSQALFNLVDNAIKYTPDGGQIELAARMDGQEIEISVRDNGMGITAELLPHVFELFQQDERTLDRSQGGLGIGLTLVQRLVEMHGGRIKAHSEGPGLGSTFTVWLSAKAISVQPAAPEAAGKSGAASGVRVLIVDDDYFVADSTTVVLELHGHEVRVAHTGQAALEMVPDFRPQVVLLDIGLKGMDGFETARRLRELPQGRELRLVAVTGYGDEKTRMRALASGCDYFLVKPVNYANLGALLADVPGDAAPMTG